MTILETVAAAPRRRAQESVQFGFAATLFLSATLIFSIEPMFSKMVLPVLGGTSSVWSVAMVVFQGLLLAGYVYAHLLTRFFSLRVSALIHISLLAIATLCLPIAIAPAFRTAPPEHLVSFWLIGLFLASVGIPCFALSANAPLLQAWIARRDQASNPYLLYRASNLGSFAALIAYPSLIEPHLGLVAQSRWWSFGFAGLLAAAGACGFAASRWGANEIPMRQEAKAAHSTLAGGTRLRWIALSFIPSGLLVAVTAHIATDVASTPFLWVLPLALYLLTFVLVFSERPAISERTMLFLQPASIAALAVLLLWGAKANWGLALIGNLFAFFVAAMICHARLYRERPPAAELTQFYAYLSLGGVLGGIFSALLAPILFPSVFEYPLLAMAALFARSDIFLASAEEWRKELVFVGMLVALVLVLMAVETTGVFGAAVMALAAYLALQVNVPSRMLPLAAVLLGATTLVSPSQHIVEYARSFYGVYKVTDVDGGRFRVLLHGTTAHGAERLSDDHGNTLRGRPAPLTYYAFGGAFDQAIEAARHRTGRLSNVALVGLGVGALTCHAQPGEHWTIYELDPLVVTIAGDSGLFRSVTSCLPQSPIVLGDGRLTLAKASTHYDLLLLDIFSSDAVPTHMLTKEAFALYKSKLTPHGVIAFNIANHNLELASVVAGSAAANGMVTAIKTDAPWPADSMKLRAQIAVVAKSQDDLKALGLDRGWREVAADPATELWTDDYSNVVGAVLRRARE